MQPDLHYINITLAVVWSKGGQLWDDGGQGQASGSRGERRT